MKYLSIVFISLLSLNTKAQNIEMTAEDSVKGVINRFFEGMKKHDTTMIRASLAPEVIFQTISRNKKSEIVVRTEGVADFLKYIAEHTSDDLDERITFDMIRIDGNLASVWTPYRFYVNTKFSHCGANSFQIVRLNNVWQIQYIIDTRRRDCE